MNGRSSEGFVEVDSALDNFRAGSGMGDHLDERNLLIVSELRESFLPSGDSHTRCGGLKGWPMRMRSGFVHAVMN